MGICSRYSPEATCNHDGRSMAGSIPPEFAGLSALRELELRFNGLTGAFEIYLSRISVISLRPGVERLVVDAADRPPSNNS